MAVEDHIVGIELDELKQAVRKIESMLQCVDPETGTELDFGQVTVRDADGDYFSVPFRVYEGKARVPVLGSIEFWHE